MNCPNCGCHLTILGSARDRSIAAYRHRGGLDIPRGGWHSSMDPPGFTSNGQPDWLARQNHEAAGQNRDSLRVQREALEREDAGRNMAIPEREFPDRDFTKPKDER